MPRVSKKTKNEATSKPYANEDLVTKSEFARQVGVSWTWIHKKIQDGSLPFVDGLIPLESGLKAFDKLEKRKVSRRAAKEEPLPDDDNEQLSDELKGAKNVTSAFNRARLIEKSFQAKLKEIEFRTKRGELIEVEKVKEDAKETAANLRGRLMALPVRISALCEGRPAREIEEILEDALNDVLTEFNESEFL